MTPDDIVPRLTDREKKALLTAIGGVRLKKSTVGEVRRGLEAYGLVDGHTVTDLGRSVAGLVRSPESSPRVLPRVLDSYESRPGHARAAARSPTGREIERDVTDIVRSPDTRGVGLPGLSLPRGWGDWSQAERRLQAVSGSSSRRGGFVCWAESSPLDPSEERYAVVRDSDGLVRWARVSPSPDLPIEYSSGAFYDDEDRSEDAVGRAKRAAARHKEKVAALVAG